MLALSVLAAAWLPSASHVLRPGGGRFAPNLVPAAFMSLASAARLDRIRAEGAQTVEFLRSRQSDLTPAPARIERIRTEGFHTVDFLRTRQAALTPAPAKIERIRTEGAQMVEFLRSRQAAITHAPARIERIRTEGAQQVEFLRSRQDALDKLEEPSWLDLTQIPIHVYDKARTPCSVCILYTDKTAHHQALAPVFVVSHSLFLMFSPRRRGFASPSRSGWPPCAASR